MFRRKPTHLDPNMFLGLRGKIVGVTASCADLMHAGHDLMLEESWNELKRRCQPGQEPFMIFLLQDDPTVDRASKNRPVQSLEERRIQVSARRFVSRVHVYRTEVDLEMLLAQLAPFLHVRFIGEDWKGKPFTGHDLPIETFWNTRKHTYSTTLLRQRVWQAEEERRAHASASESRREERAEQSLDLDDGNLVPA